MKKIVSIGIICLLLITVSISATCIPLDKYVLNDNNSEPGYPVTQIGYDGETGMVTLVAVDYPINGASGVKATYYKIDGGTKQTYTEPFFIGEGTHEIEFWSEDNVGNVEAHKTRTYTYDILPPTVEIIQPEEGKIHLFGRFVFNNFFSEETICIGKLQISVNANDGNGTGVNTVFFSYGNETAYDNDGSDGWTDTNRVPYFGKITISVTAIDNIGLMSNPVHRSVTVYSLGS